MIIIPREELNREALSPSRPRGDAGLFDKWLTSASGKKTDSIPLQEPAVRANLYSNRQWRCE